MNHTIIELLQKNTNINVYLYCKPITDSPPEDLKEIKKITNKYWSAKIYTKPKNQNKLNEYSNWFSIPIINVFSLFNTKPKGEMIINLNYLSKNHINILFSNTNPTFKFNNNISISQLNWINNYN